MSVLQNEQAYVSVMTLLCSEVKRCIYGEVVQLNLRPSALAGYFAWWWILAARKVTRLSSDKFWT
jgi:hypothetical protein